MDRACIKISVIIKRRIVSNFNVIDCQSVIDLIPIVQQLGVAIRYQLTGLTFTTYYDAQARVLLVEDLTINFDILHGERFLIRIIIKLTIRDTGEVSRRLVEHVVIGFGYLRIAKEEAVALDRTDFHSARIEIAGNILDDTTFYESSVRACNAQSLTAFN